MNKNRVIISKIAKVLSKKDRPVLFSTISLKGAPRSRYIGAFIVRDIGEIYLISPSNTNKMQEVRKNQRAQVIFSSEDCHQVLTLSGKAYVVEDDFLRYKIYEEKKNLKMYPTFSNDFGVIHFVSGHAEYLDIDVSNKQKVIKIA